MTFKHYLNFLSLPTVGKIRISEPFGFDGSSFKVKQDDKRFGRDVYIADEEIELEFTREEFERLNEPQRQLNGQVIEHASLGFDYLLDVFQNEGWEGKVEHIIEDENNVEFIRGNFDMFTAIVSFDSIKFKIIQDTNRELIKRLEDTDVNAFSNLAIDEREIEPCNTVDVLLKALPINQNSQWENVGSNTFADSNIPSKAITAFNFAQNITKYGINNTLTFFENLKYSPGGLTPEFATFKIIKATTKLSEINVKHKINMTYSVTQGAFQGPGVVALYLIYGDTFDATPNPRRIILYNDSFPSGTVKNVTVNQEFEHTIDFIDAGESIWLYWVVFGGLDCDITGNVISTSTNITAISTAIDTVVKGIRLIDLVKHNVKSLADIPVIAPAFDVGGEHYDTFLANGYLLGQITDKPFNNKLSELINFVQETCSDYQIKPDSFEILPYNDFYTNVDLGSFYELPNSDQNTIFNKRYALTNAEFKYKKSSSERETNGANSIDDVHTETQKFLSDAVNGSLKVEINHIRSAPLIEQARQRAFDNEQTTSLQNDDSLFFLDCIRLAPNTRSGFVSVLAMQVQDDGTLKILNNNLAGDLTNFNWTLLGFKVGASFTIEGQENAGTYTVLSVDTSVVTLTPVTATPDFSGDAFIKVSWVLNNVLYTNRTTEGFETITGINALTGYSNLMYSWGRNIKRWYPYLATATNFKRNGKIKTTSFKINGKLETKLFTETEVVSDSADIINSDISDLKVLTPFVHSVSVFADFEAILQLVKDVEDLKGFVRVKLIDGRMIKGHIKELDYVWSTGELDLEIEERFESDYMTIVKDGDTIFVNEVGYDEKIGLNKFIINGIYVLLFDNNNIEITKPIRYTNISINGIVYGDLVEFSDAMFNILT